MTRSERIAWLANGSLTALTLAGVLVLLAESDNSETEKQTAWRIAQERAARKLQENGYVTTDAGGRVGRSGRGAGDPRPARDGTTRSCSFADA